MRRLTPKQIGGIRSAISAIERQKAPITQKQAARRIELYRVLGKAQSRYDYEWDALCAQLKAETYRAEGNKKLSNLWHARKRAAHNSLRWVDKTAFALQIHWSSRNVP